MIQGGTAFNYGTTPFRLRGLGMGSITPTECEMYGSNPPPGCPGNTSSGSGSTGSKFDWNKVADAGNKLLDVFSGKTAATYPTPLPENKSNTGKIVLIGVGVLAAAGITYLIVRKSKKKGK